MNNPLIITPTKITLSNYKFNKTAYAITMVLMYITGALPVVAGIILLSSGVRLNFGFFITVVLFALMAYFFYRLATWNKFGKEHFLIQDGILTYAPEAKKISFKKQELPVDLLKLSLVRYNELDQFNDEEVSLGKIQFEIDNQVFENSLKSPIPILRELLQNLESWGVNTTIDFEELQD